MARKPGTGLSGESAAAAQAVAAAAVDSDWAQPLMSAVTAWSTVAPRKGEAGNWIIWSAMTAAGLSRAVIVSVGYLIARGGETRIRAAVLTGVLVLAVALAWLAGQAS